MKTIPARKAAAIRAVWSMNFAKAKPMKPTRRIFHVTQRLDAQWQCLESCDYEPLFESNKKKSVVKLAARYLSNLWYSWENNGNNVDILRDHHKPGMLSELIIHLRNGKIPKGSHGRRTYGKDPRRSKG